MGSKRTAQVGRALCLVLNSRPYGEADLVLTLFAREEGLISARAYGARSLKSRIRAACQPFCLAEFDFYIRGEHRSVKEASIRQDMTGLLQHYDAYLCGCMILELTEKVLRYADEYEALFRLTLSSLLYLEDDPREPERVLLFFLLRLIHLLGIFPVFSTCASCGARTDGVHWWSHSEGGAVCKKCAALLPVEVPRPEILRCLRSFGRGQLQDLQADPAEITAIRQTAAFLLTYLHSQYGITLRTARALALDGKG